MNAGVRGVSRVCLIPVRKPFSSFYFIHIKWPYFEVNHNANFHEHYSQICRRFWTRVPELLSLTTVCRPSAHLPPLLLHSAPVAGEWF
jgi:hypothetical protein